MSNLDSARSAIESEIEHARKGLSFYEERIGSLEKMLRDLGAIDGVANHGTKPTGMAPKKRGRKPMNADQTSAVNQDAVGASKKAGKKASKKGGVASGDNDLPFTGGTYWQDLVTNEGKSAKEILEAAISTLTFAPSKVQIQKLQGRMTFALNALVKANTIRDSGRGRERRFFKD
jgi:hypothetical protein